MSKRYGIGVVAGLLVLGAAGGVAYAKVTGSGGTINACYAPGSYLHLAGPTGSCRAGETALSWNQQGPAGPAGPAGPTGPAGPAASLATTTVWGDIAKVPPLGYGQAEAHCPSSTTATASGYFYDSFGTAAPLVVTASELVDNRYALIGFFNPSDFAIGMANAIVYCAPAS